MTLKRLALPLALLLLAYAAAPAPTPACPFCVEERGPTLVGDYQQASIVLLGTFSNAKRVGKDGVDGTTDFTIEKRLKDHPIIGGKTTITLPKYLPPTKSKFIIFCDVYQNMIDPYRGIEVQNDSDMVAYLSKALDLKDQGAAKRLRHCFDYLNSADLDVAMDAYREFAKADYTDYRDMAKTLPADKIATWLQDPKTPPFRYGLYASLLGHCGDKKKHGDLLRGMIDDPDKRMGSGIDGLMAGYLMLQPEEGWKHLEALLKNGKENFGVRYAALKTIRFYWDTRPDLFPKKQLIEGAALVLAHPDMADFAIEDFRKWNRWEMADRVLELFDKQSHDVPVVRRAILRYALHCTAKNGSPRAKTFIDEQRKIDRETVDDTEALLQADLQAPPPAEIKK